MLRELKNKDGEQLYTVLINSTKEFAQHVTITTWEKAKQLVIDHCKERDDESWMCKVISMNINEECHRIIAEVVKNHKGWGYDYFEYVCVTTAYES